MEKIEEYPNLMALPDKRNYWIISQLFYPNETSTAFVMTKIAECVAKFGNINVICGEPSYHSDVLNNVAPLNEQIVIHRINIRVNKNNLLLRLCSSILLSFKISWKILRKVKTNDSLILVTNPPMIILFVSALKRLKKFKMYILVHDVFPENLAVTGIVKQTSFLYKALLSMFNTAYNKADHLITCGSDMREVFKKKTTLPPISVITNWADHTEIYPSDIDLSSYYNINVSDKIVLQFAGNVGRVQGLDNFVELFSNVDSQHLFLVILGDGAFKQKIVDLKNKHNLQNIIFLPSKPRTEQNFFLNACDIGLVTLSPGMFGLGVPSKVYNILSAGKPILYIGDVDSEIYNYIKQYSIGWAFTWNEQEQIKTFLASLLPSKKEQMKQKGKQARQLVIDKFTREDILRQYEKILKN